MFKPKHNQVLMQGFIKSAPKEPIELNEWLTDLVKSVGMNVVAGPISKYVSETGNEGITGVVSLATSHVAIHIWDEQTPIFFQFDIYSCSDFLLSNIIEYFDRTFGLITYKYLQIDRNDFDFKIVDKN